MIVTKTELGIIEAVRFANSRNALAGLNTTPFEDSFDTNEFRFVRRLHDQGLIVWVPRIGQYGAGWVLSENVEKFQQKTRYELHVYCRRNDVSRDAGLHATSEATEEEAMTELAQEAKSLLGCYDEVFCCIEKVSNTERAVVRRFTLRK